MLWVKLYLENLTATDPAGGISQDIGWQCTGALEASSVADRACAVLTAVQQKLRRVGQVEA
jgi:hypothetical protein